MSDSNSAAEQHTFGLSSNTANSLPIDPMENPFKVVVDPAVRARLIQAIGELIDTRDQELASHVGEGVLALDSYKEYIELFARNLCDTLGSKDGISFLLESCGFHIPDEEINLHPQPRWLVHR